jgi:hypothetical protein
MAKAGSDNPPAESEFASAERIEQARKALSKAKTKEEVIAVFGAHVNLVGWKRLGRLLTGRDVEARE